MVQISTAAQTTLPGAVWAWRCGASPRLKPGERAALLATCILTDLQMAGSDYQRPPGFGSGDLARFLGCSRSTVSGHLKRLAQIGLLESWHSGATSLAYSIPEHCVRDMHRARRGAQLGMSVPPARSERL